MPILGIVASSISGNLWPAGSFESIATATGTGSNSTITFSSIPSTYVALQIRFNARSTTAFVDDFVSFRFNSDSATNYAWHFIEGTGTSASAAAGTSSDIAYSAQITGATATANVMGVGIFEIIDYASTTKAKTVRSVGGNDRNNDGNLRFTSDLWTGTSAINRIDITSFRGANWNTQTQFALYGIKG